LICGKSIIDDEMTRKFLKSARINRGLDIDPNLAVEESLEKLELMQGSDFTYAAVLLFGKIPQIFVTQA
jgi:predicted HTH transcriptional regulator